MDDLQSTRAPAPGEASSRTAATENNYIKRALWFAAHTSRHLGLEDPSPTEVVAYAFERRPEWTKSTWRQTKAALIFRYESMGTPQGLDAVRILREAGDQTECISKSTKTSGRRAKSVTDSQFDTLLGKIRASNSQYSAMLESWLIMGTICGARPHEWTQSELIYELPSKIDPEGHAGSGLLDLERPYLRIENAKGTNGRSHGKNRHIDLSSLDQLLLDAVSRFCTSMRRLAENGDYQVCYQGCQKLLYRINSESRIRFKGAPKWVQIYSSRHIFSANAKRVLEAREVSALMGHGVDRTASSHYGRRRGGGGAVDVRPVEAEVTRVRKTLKSYNDSVLAARARAGVPAAGKDSST